jgi:hypothetical protein
MAPAGGVDAAGRQADTQAHRQAVWQAVTVHVAHAGPAAIGHRHVSASSPELLHSDTGLKLFFTTAAVGCVETQAAALLVVNDWRNDLGSAG